MLGDSGRLARREEEGCWRGTWCAGDTGGVQGTVPELHAEGLTWWMDKAEQ